MRDGMRGALVSGLCLALAACAAPAAGPMPATAPQAAPPAPAVAVVVRPPVDRGERWTGLGLQPVTEEIAGRLTLARVEGLHVIGVEPESPGFQAGVRAGDVLLLAGGTYMDRPETLSRVLAASRPGSVLELSLRRGGDLIVVRLLVTESPRGRLMAVIRPPGPGLLGVAADGATLWAFGVVPGGADRGIVPIQLPGGALPPVGPRPVASPIAERVIAADGERVYLAWVASEVHVDAYDLQTGRALRVPVQGAEQIVNRCQARGLARVGGELWLACRRTDGPVVARIDLASGQTRVESLPATYWGGLAFDGEAVLWLCCPSGGRVALSRTPVGSSAGQLFPLPEPVTSVAADGGAVYLLGANAVYVHKPWR